LYNENQGAVEPRSEGGNEWGEGTAVVTAAAEGGYYDDFGNWVESEEIVSTATEDAGYSDDFGNWVESDALVPTATADAGYYDDYGEWVDGTEPVVAKVAVTADEGYYDENGEWMDGAAAAATPAVASAESGAAAEETSGYYDDATGDWVEGYYDAEGNWVGIDPGSAGGYGGDADQRLFAEAGQTADY
jgi:hypothetical protein